LKPSGINVNTVFHKSNTELINSVSTDASKGHSIVLLDENGAGMNSLKFSDNLYNWLESGGSRLSFVIGGAEGLPNELKAEVYSKSKPSLSLSPMTFTHMFARTLLVEQLYRASEIRKGSGYHKE